jgi:hypothetical protein
LLGSWHGHMRRKRVVHGREKEKHVMWARKREREERCPCANGKAATVGMTGTSRGFHRRLQGRSKRVVSGDPAIR